MTISSGRGAFQARRRGALRRALLVSAALASVAMLGTAPSAGAISVQQEYAKFSDCPVEAPGLKQCVYAQTTSGEFVIGSRAVPINKTITIQGGVKENGELVPALDGNTLSKTPLKLPGGLLGIPQLEIGGEVTATAELAGTGFLSASNVIAESGTAATLPLKVKLSNPALGEQCYIGSSSEPVLLQLTTGTTSPPGPNKPISGKAGEITLEPSVIIHIENNSLVDNAFSAPGVNGCGGLLSILLDPAIDLDAGLPAASGHNTAILNGTLDATTPASVKAHLALPQIGRCVKVKGVREGTTIVYHGAYENSSCVSETVLKVGQYEWEPGPGAAKKFTATSGTTNLTSAGGSRIRCLASTSVGEYTGPKTASLAVTYTGCEQTTSKHSCQSSGRAAGEIATSQLEGHLGFIRDTWTKEEGLHVSVGLDLKHEPALFTAECGGTPVSVGGSVIGTFTTFDKMGLKSALKYVVTEGKQSPEAFEFGAKDTLTTAFGGGSAEQAGLTGTQAITNEEKLEIKAEAE
jgi:hypothetical protein